MDIVVKNAETYFGKDEKEEFQRYLNNLDEDLKEAGYDEETKRDYRYTLVEYMKNYYAARAISEKYNSLNSEYEKYANLYKNEPNDEKAKEYLKKANAIRNRQKVLKSIYEHFDSLVQSKQPEVTEIGAKIDSRVKENNHDGRSETPSGPKYPTGRP